MKKNILIVLMILILGSVFTFADTHKNVIFGAYVKYKSSTEITVTAGSGRCNDTFWEITSEIDVNLYSVLPAGEDYLYIYIDDSGSSYPTPTIYGDTTEPTWSDSKIGWYYGNDRCIGTVWVNSSSNIEQFQNNSSLEYIPYQPIKEVLTGGNPTGSYQTVETTAYIPINATAVYVTALNRDSDGDSCYVAVSPAENANSRLVNSTYKSWSYIYGWLSLDRGFGRDLQWNGSDDDNNEFKIKILGYRIDR